MGLDDLDVEFRRQGPGRPPDEVHQQRNTEAGVGGDEHGNLARGGIELRFRQLGRQARRPDEQRLARGAACGKVGAGGMRLGEVDHDVRRR